MGETQLNLLGPRPDGLATRAIIAGQLTDAIMSRALAAGTEIRQQQLANHYGVSRMPVREAIRELQAKGLLEHRPHRSPVVMPLQPAEQLSLPQAMARIEALEKALEVARDVFDTIAGAQESVAPDVKQDVATRRSMFDQLLGNSESPTADSC